MLGRYDIFEGLIGKGSCEGTQRRLLGGALHSPGQEAETHATYLIICFHES